MLTVAILKNGHPLTARSAVRIRDGVYQCDDGTIIKHPYEEGAVALAKKMLDTIDPRDDKEFILNGAMPHRNKDGTLKNKPVYPWEEKK